MYTAATILSAWSTLEQVRTGVLAGKLGAVMSISAVLAAILAAAAILRVSTDYIEGHGGGIWQMARPLVLLVLVCQFNTLVLSPVGGLVNIFTRDLASAVDVSTREYVEQWGRNMAMVESYALRGSEDRQQAELEELSKGDLGPAGKFFMKIWLGVKKYLRDLFSVGTFTIGALIGAVLFLIVKILLFAQQVLCSMYLTIVGLIGPLVFALSIIKGVSDGIGSWIARYIQIAMWVPIGYIVMYINLQVGSVFLTSVSAAGSADLGTEWFMTALQVVALVSVAAVPKIAAWVIDSTGANDAHGSITQPAKNMAGRFLRF